MSAIISIVGLANDEFVHDERVFLEEEQIFFVNRL